MTLNFALIGAGGYVAPRHIKAIHMTGNRLAAATDPNDSVGVLDSYTVDVRFFPEIERFDRHLEKLRRGPEEGRIQYVSICSPNFLHDAHVRLAMRVGANAICEKPLVITPWNLDALTRIEEETGCRVFNMLQLRVHPALIALRQRLQAENSGPKHDVRLTYITARGPWYHQSWKGSEERSGGLVMNIGIHLFDMLIWLFGDVEDNQVLHRGPRRAAGYLELSRATVRWYLSVETEDLPMAPEGARTTFRSITVDGEEVEFSGGFADLHTEVYKQVLAGQGHGIEDARPSIELVHQIRFSEISSMGLDSASREFFKDRPIA